MAEAQPVFDAAKYKSAQHDQWNEDAAAWHRWGPTLQRWLGSVTQRMLDLAQLGPGQQSGFRDIQIHGLSTPLHMASAAECIRFERESFGAFNQLMAHLPRERRETIWDEAEVAMQEFEGPDGFLAPCEPLVAAGAK
jgi:hypothetical protein